MPRYRAILPQLSSDLFLTDGGAETTLIFREGLDLPHFAAFDLLKTREGLASLKRYYGRYAALAEAERVGFILESPTWRASRDWGERLGYSSSALADANRRAIDLMVEVREAFEMPQTPMVISGCIGPRSDGYGPDQLMSVREAWDYHHEQVATFATSEADMVTAMTISYPEEAIGIVKAAQSAKMPVAISWTVEIDGRLPTGQPLQAAIAAVDEATSSEAAYHMINCAHPSHFASLFEGAPSWTARIRGIRANASMRSHAELDNAADLDDGDPVELGREYRALLQMAPHITVLGGCCGTDHRHVEQICHHCRPMRGRTRFLTAAA